MSFDQFAMTLMEARLRYNKAVKVGQRIGDDEFVVRLLNGLDKALCGDGSSGSPTPGH
jgi:hypothetical protein